MKKITTIFTLILFVSLAMAQGGKVGSAITLIDAYKMSQNGSDLVKAKEAIEAATVHEKTIGKGKTWYIYGEVLMLMGQDANLKEAEPDVFMDALAAFEKTQELNSGKVFYLQDEMNMYIMQLAADLFNTGLDANQNKDYDRAYDYYTNVKRVKKMADDFELELTFDATIAEEEAIKSAVLGGRGEEIIDQLDKGIYYNIIVADYMEKGDNAKAKEIIEMGLEKFPEDENLYINYINIALKDNQVTEAMSKIDKVLELQPENDQLYFIRGNAYDKVGETEKAATDYDKAIELNPKNDKALYNAGAMYFNQANEFIKQMNELNYNETKKYDELNAQRMTLYKKAKPYFEKVLALNPEDDSATRAITKINSALETE